MRAIEWVDDHLRLLDQTKIPHKIEFIDVLKVDQLIEKYRSEGRLRSYTDRDYQNTL